MTEIRTDTDHLRYWIYSCSKELNEDQQAEIGKLGQNFIDQWASHGNKLKAEFKILYGHFLVFFVDEASAGASGCSIDSSVKLMKEIESQYGLDLFDRQKVAFLENGKVVFHRFSELPELYRRGRIRDDSMVFNHVLDRGSHFDREWLKSLSDSPFAAGLR